MLTEDNRQVETPQKTKVIKAANRGSDGNAVHADAAAPMPNASYFRAESLGEGGCGAVMTVYDEDGAEWAAKCFDENIDGTIDFSTLREVSLLALLRREDVQHPNIVKLHDMCWIEGSLCQIMPRYPQSLAAAIDGGAFRKAPERNKVAHGLLDGVTFLHNNGIMHRDLKTANVLLTEEMVPKIIDFSLAKIFALQEAIVSSTSAGGKKKKKESKKKRQEREESVVGACGNSTNIGTPMFIPPEIFYKESYDCSADIWSLGIVLMCVYSADLHKELMKIDREKAAHAKIAEMRGKLSPEKPLPRLLRSMVEVDPEQRPSANQALCDFCGFTSPAMEPTACPPSQFLAQNQENRKQTKNSKEPAWFGFSADEKEIKKWYDTFGLVNPLTRVAAFAYLQACRSKSIPVPAFACVILAGRLFELEQNEPLDDLTEIQFWLQEMQINEPILWQLDLEDYMAQEKKILTAMDYSLYVPPPSW